MNKNTSYDTVAHLEQEWNEYKYILNMLDGINNKNPEYVNKVIKRIFPEYNNKEEIYTLCNEAKNIIAKILLDNSSFNTNSLAFFIKEYALLTGADIEVEKFRVYGQHQPGFIASSIKEWTIAKPVYMAELKDKVNPDTGIIFLKDYWSDENNCGHIQTFPVNTEVALGYYDEELDEINWSLRDHFDQVIPGIGEKFNDAINMRIQDKVGSRIALNTQLDIMPLGKVKLRTYKAHKDEGDK